MVCENSCVTRIVRGDKKNVADLKGRVITDFRMPATQLFEIRHPLEMSDHSREVCGFNQPPLLVRFFRRCI